LKGKKTEPPLRPSHRIFERQTRHDPAAHIFTARCGICGKEKSLRKYWFRGRDETIRRLRRRFAFCNSCKRWVCEDCFLIDDGTGAIGICTECAKRQGITGYTEAQFEEAWPEIKKRGAPHPRKDGGADET
jgi:hypothetical protein